MANIQDLVLLCNDPEVAEEFLQAARRGDVDAQYGMGLIYAEGRGVPQDESKAYFWLTRAMEQGDQEADVLRNIVATSMTPGQFLQARQLVEQNSATSIASPKRAKRQRSKVHY